MSTKAKKEARKLLDQFKIKEVPVPVEVIAEKLGAKIVEKPFSGNEPLSGALIRTSKSTVIAINGAVSDTRKRFTLAHELAHLVLHKGDIFVDVVPRVMLKRHAEVNMRNASPSRTEDKKELEANQFAAELLMPKELIDEFLTLLLDESPSLDVEDLIETLAKQFGVSQRTMEYRLVGLGLLVGLG